jgi:YbbR domain-containing protein
MARRFSLNREKLIAKITEKWPAKILSVAAALVISVFYRMNTLETRTFTVPLRVYENNLLIPVTSAPNTVRVNVRGDAAGVLSIQETDIEAYIDLNKYASEGAYRIPVQIQKKGRALGVEPLEISVIPIEIPLSLDQKTSRRIPVFPVTSGTIASGYELTSQTIAPESVIAEGPRSVLAAQFNFITETVDLENRFGDFNAIINIENTNPLITILGNRTIEYRGTISRIQRVSRTEAQLIETNEENGE